MARRMLRCAGGCAFLPVPREPRPPSQPRGRPTREERAAWARALPGGSETRRRTSESSTRPWGLTGPQLCTETPMVPSCTITPSRGRGDVTAAPGPAATQHTPGPAAAQAATSVCPTTGALSFDSSNAQLLGRNVREELPCSGSHVPAPGPLPGGVYDVKGTKATTGGQRPRPRRPRPRMPSGHPLRPCWHEPGSAGHWPRVQP